jgi:hypothetical protein
MSYFEDLSDYNYSQMHRPRTKNVGWLDSAHQFPREPPTETLLDLIWGYCKISVAQTRGIHYCELCAPGDSTYVVRNGEPLLLGTSEIRVFPKDGVIYAAPTLIYHYVSAHHYQPPEEFVKALSESPRPPSQEYFERLDELGLAWRQTSAPAEKPLRIKVVRMPDGTYARERLD